MQLSAHPARQRPANHAHDDGINQIKGANVFMVRRKEPALKKSWRMVIVVRMFGCVCHDVISYPSDSFEWVVIKVTDRPSQFGLPNTGHPKCQ